MIGSLVQPCKYGTEKRIDYYYETKQKYVRYICPFKAESMSLFCCFHDPNRSDYTQDYLTQKLQDIIDDCVNGNKALECIGYFLTQNEVKLIIEKNFQEAIFFNHATFTGAINFSQSSFNDIDFSFACFSEEVYFSNVLFNTRTTFTSTEFKSSQVEFHDTTFHDVSFFGITFNHVLFSGSKFRGHAYFQSSTINGEAVFREAVFDKETDFSVSFNRVIFNKATFNFSVSFSSKFYGKANFEHVTFNCQPDFSMTKFYDLAIFAYSKFKSTPIFSYTTFMSLANFRGVVFTEKTEFETIECTMMNFENAEFDEIDFRSFKVNSELCKRNEFYEENYVIKNQGKFIEFLKGRIALRPSQTYELQVEPHRRLAAPRFSQNLTDSEKNIIYVNDKTENALFIYYLDSDNVEKSYSLCKDIPIKFDYSRFRNKARFGTDTNELDLTNFSFNGVDLSKIEFHNVRWLKIRIHRMNRNIIINEIVENPDYKAIARIYNQLRKNLESELRFAEASDFFIGEMESIRRSLWNGNIAEKLKSSGYSIYYGLARYGESILLPLAVWTPTVILTFIFIRTCDLSGCRTNELIQNIFDSFAAFFQFPRETNSVFLTNVNIVERIISAPILGTLFIALKRRFERVR